MPQSAAPDPGQHPPCILSAQGRRFVLQDGRRHWIDNPPGEVGIGQMPDLIDDQIARDWCRARGLQ